QLTNAQSSTLTYDGNGNLTNDSVKTFEYDDENQLTRITKASGWMTEFVYDGRMRLRTSRDYNWSGISWVQINEVRRIYDGNLVVQERNSGNTPTVSYTRGNDLSGSREGAGGIGGLLARNNHYYFADGNGNILRLMRGGGGSAAVYRYDPLGNMISKSGNLADANTYRFSSKEIHVNSGLYYYGYRFYDPNFQRWLNRDPIEESGFRQLAVINLDNWNDRANLYRFIYNDPIFGIDAQGLTIYVCSRKTGGGMSGVGNHSYFYDDSPPPGGCNSCGTSGSSGGSSGSSGSS
ncbi:MAG: RHS repeat-associated core domain-containing protein, partial [Limisphaerales bacterium]